MLFYVFLLFCVIVTPVFSGNCDNDTPKSQVHKLKKDLLCNYDTTIRPVIHDGNRTVVNFKLVLKYFDYNDRMNTMTVHSWMPINWNDEHLKWEPNNYNGLKSIHISSTSIWVPDIALFNSQNMEGPDSFFTTTNCLITYKGNVGCVPPSQHTAICIPNIKLWPFDEQTCSMRYGSWIHSGEEVYFNISSKKAILKEDFKPNKEWDLLNLTVKFHPGVYSSIPNQTFPHVEFIFTIKRHSSSQIATIIVPAIIMGILAVASIWLSSTTPERFYLFGISLFCHFTFLQYLHWELPPNGAECPNIVTFFKDSMIMVTFAVLETVLIRSLISSTLLPPTWLSSFTAIILNSRFGQFLLLSQSNIKISTVSGDNEHEDVTTLVASETVKDFTKEWMLLGKIIDRLTLVIYIIVYFIMLLALIP